MYGATRPRAAMNNCWEESDGTPGLAVPPEIQSRLSPRTDSSSQTPLLASPHYSGQNVLGTSDPHTSGQNTLGATDPHTSGQNTSGTSDPHTSGQKTSGTSDPHTSGQNTLGTGDPHTSGQNTSGTSDPHTSGQDALDNSSESFRLRPEVGLVGAVALIVGSIVGSGIFVSPKGVLDGVGSVGLSLVLWSVCGLISLVGSLGLVELGTMITKSGGDYAYIHAAFGSIPAFLYAWLSVLFLRPSGGSIMALTCAEYVMAPFYTDCDRSPEVLRKLVATLVIMTILGINVYSVKLANRVGVVFLFAKIASLGVIIVGGIVMLSQGKTEYLSDSFEGTRTDISRLALGFYSGMWAYDGWNNLNYSTEELINPVITLPRAILIAVPLCTACYVLVNLSYFTVMSASDVMTSPAVAVTWAERVMPWAAWVFPVFVAISTFGSAHASLFSGGRMAYAAAREGHMVGVLSMVDATNYTPSASLIFTCLVAIAMLIPSDLEELINFFSFTAWLWYGLVALALIVLRWKRPEWHRPYKVPLVFPIVTLLVATFLVLGPLIQNPQIEFLYGSLAILAGLIFYFPLVYLKKKPPGYDRFTVLIQLALGVATPSENSTL